MERISEGMGGGGMSETIVTLSEGETYFVRNGQMGWGVITINEKTGLFMAYTDYGNYCYHWNAPGDKGLKAFLADLDFSYAMGKFTGARYGRKFDNATAIASLKRDIINRRRDNQQIGMEVARAAWDDLHNLEDAGDSEDYFMSLLAREPDILDAIGPDDWWHCVDGKVNDPQCVGFWNHIFIPFVASYCPDHKLKAVAA